MISLAIALLVILGIGVCMQYYYRDKPAVVVNPDSTSVVYKNADYGFTFSLPDSWKGYSVVTTAWNGSALKGTATSTGPKLLIRNPKWTAASPYEDIPVLVFTISQWNAYLAEDFSVSAAPILATEFARNNVYVFALPPRWNYDYSLGYKEAEDIVAGGPLHAFNL